VRAIRVCGVYARKYGKPFLKYLSVNESHRHSSGSVNSACINNNDDDDEEEKDDDGRKASNGRKVDESVTLFTSCPTRSVFLWTTPHGAMPIVTMLLRA